MCIFALFLFGRQSRVYFKISDIKMGCISIQRKYRINDQKERKKGVRADYAEPRLQIKHNELLSYEVQALDRKFLNKMLLLNNSD